MGNVFADQLISGLGNKTCCHSGVCNISKISTIGGGRGARMADYQVATTAPTLRVEVIYQLSATVAIF